MNQILMMGNRNSKNNGGNSGFNIKKVVTFFAVAIIIFGLIFIVKGVIGLGKNKTENDQSTEPQGDNPDVVETATPDIETTPIPDEDNYAPTLDLSIIGNKVKVIATDDVGLAYIEYTWNNGEQKVIEVTEDDKRAKEAYIDIIAGQNTLRVNAVDLTGKEQDQEIPIKGKVLPEIELFITPDGKSVIIKAKCTDGLNHVEWRTDGGQPVQIKFSDENASATKEQWAMVGVTTEHSEDGKVVSMEYTYTFPEGSKTILIYAYSLIGEVSEKQGSIE